MCSLLLPLVFVAQVAAQEARLCRISVENPSSHFQAAAARRFAESFAAKTRGSIEVEFYDGAKLFRDVDALGALSRGQVEIILPGLWQLDRYVPEVGALMLPSVYGRSVPTMRAIVDGPFGQTLVSRVESTLGTVALGPWLDAGYAHIFTLERTVRSAKDIAGKRIRVAGGKGNEERIRALGADTMSIPLADLASYLENLLIDGILSTYEAVDSARLDRYGIKAVFEDEEYYPFYVPLAARRFWDALDDGERRAATEAWAETVRIGREEAVKAHAEARARLISRGLVVFPNDERERVREFLVRSEVEIARRLNIPAETVRALTDELRGRQ